jgi:hypothetical protein
MMFGTRICIDGVVFSCGPEEFVIFIFKGCEFVGIVSNMGARWRCACLLIRLVKCGSARKVIGQVFANKQILKVAFI